MQLAKGYAEVRPRAPDMRARPAELPVRHHQRFEWTTNEIVQFRELSRIGNHISVRGGVRIDGVDHRGDVHEREIACTSADDATTVYNELVADLNGRVPTIEVPERVSTYKPAEHPQLEQQCRDAPGSHEPWSVYADWLIAQGDPLGELAQCAAAGKLAAAKSVLRQHQLDLIGTSDYHVPDFEYRHGFVVGATISIQPTGLHSALQEITEKFLAGPLARFVESLRFGLAGFEGDNDWSGTLRAVVESRRATQLRALRFDHYDREDSELSAVAFGDFASAWDKLPALELLHIKSGAGGTLGTLDLPALRTFIRESGGLAQAELDAIASARWPRLEHLEIWFGAPRYGAAGTLASLREILKGKLPRLAHLGVVNAGFADEVIGELASHPVLSKLSSLDLSKGTLGRDGAALLVRKAARFRHLASLDLSENLLDPDDVRRIRAVLDNVIVEHQRTQREDEDEDNYVAIGE
jgi:hypothetical protein